MTKPDKLMITKPIQVILSYEDWEIAARHAKKFNVHINSWISAAIHLYIDLVVKESEKGKK